MTSALPLQTKVHVSSLRWLPCFTGSVWGFRVFIRLHTRARHDGNIHRGKAVFRRGDGWGEGDGTHLPASLRKSFSCARGLLTMSFDFVKRSG